MGLEYVSPKLNDSISVRMSLLAGAWVRVRVEAAVRAAVTVTVTVAVRPCPSRSVRGARGPCQGWGKPWRMPCASCEMPAGTIASWMPFSFVA